MRQTGLEHHYLWTRLSARFLDLNITNKQEVSTAVKEWIKYWTKTFRQKTIQIRGRTIRAAIPLYL